MVARCLPGFKESASLITPPPFLRRLSCVLFSAALAPRAHHCSWRLCLSLYFWAVCHPAAFPCGVYVQFAPIGSTLAKWRAVLMESLCSERVGGWVGCLPGNPASPPNLPFGPRRTVVSLSCGHFSDPLPLSSSTPSKANRIFHLSPLMTLAPLTQPSAAARPQ